MVGWRLQCLLVALAARAGWCRGRHAALPSLLVLLQHVSLPAERRWGSMYLNIL